MSNLCQLGMVVPQAHATLTGSANSMARTLAPTERKLEIDIAVKHDDVALESCASIVDAVRTPVGEMDFLFEPQSMSSPAGHLDSTVGTAMNDHERTNVALESSERPVDPA